MGKRRSLEDLSVREILLRRPESAQVFLELRTLCVGCSMARFCTPRDVASSYSLDLPALLSLLEKGKGNGR